MTSKMHAPKYIISSEPLVKVFCVLAQSVVLNVDVFEDHFIGFVRTYFPIINVVS